MATSPSARCSGGGSTARPSSGGGAEAHWAGLPITGHAHGAQGIAEAIAAGFDGIEHAAFLTAYGVNQDPAVVDQLAARQVVVSVTAAQTQPPGQPPPGMEPGSDLARRSEQLAKQLKAMVAGVLRLRAAGVPLTISSDADIGPHKPHDVLPWAPGWPGGRLHRGGSAAGGHVGGRRRLPGRGP